MKKRLKHLNFLILLILILLFISINQIVWIYDLYKLHQRENGPVSNAYIDYIDLENNTTMPFQLLLSIILMLSYCFGMFILLRTIFFQHKDKEMKQLFVSTMIHELKRPIEHAMNSLGLASRYLDLGQTEKVLSKVEEVQFGLEKLSAYAKEIQDISRNEETKIQLNKELIEADFFIRKLCEFYKEEIEIQYTRETKENQIFADAVHFSNIMDNLIENAIKYSETPAYIFIRISEDTFHWIITIKDKGYGIANSEINAIFEKFYRCHDVRSRKKDGLGLGLSYVKVMVEAHHGSIKVESELNIGSTFIISLPKQS